MEDSAPDQLFVRRWPLWQVGRGLTDVCMGRRPADTIIRNGRVVDVHTREILDAADVAIAHGRVAMFGDAAHTVGPDTEVIDAEGAFLVPGLIDTHVHVESSLVTVVPFANAVVPSGTTTVLIENHDMANVFGMEGVRWMTEESRGLQLKVLLAVPTCVPPLRALESSGAVIDPEDVRVALGWDETGGLGEMMNMSGILEGDPLMHEMVANALERNLPATGHWALSGWNDHRLHAYAACGIDSCHESVTREDALAKLRAGMWMQMREGSAWHDIEATVKVLTEDGVDSRHVLLITDDMQPASLLADGQMSNAVRVAIACGLDPIVAIQAATINPAEYLGRRADLGSIAPGRCADILFIEELAEMRPHFVLCDGRPFVEEDATFRYPERVRESIRIPSDLSPVDLKIRAGGDHATVRAIGIVTRVVPTEHRLIEVPVEAGEVRASAAHDLAKLALVNRHGGPKEVALGFVQGMTLTHGAIAQSVARDTHHMLSIGMDDDDMVFAMRELERIGGGLIAVSNGEVLAVVRLPIAGLVSDRSVPEVAVEVEALLDAYTSLGCTIEHPFMMVALLAVSAIPELRIGNRGLIDSREFKLVEPVLA